MREWIAFPYSCKSSSEFTARYLYAVGGYHSIDNGCPAWGTSNPDDIRFIGDRMGDLVVRYSDESETRIPLIFGYTMWWHSIWGEKPAPFLGSEADAHMNRLLKSSLHIHSAYENAPHGTIKIELEDKPISSICIEAAEDKNGFPVFVGGHLCSDDSFDILYSSGSFFTDHTISGKEPYPEKIQTALSDICHALHTFESDFAEAPQAFEFPEEPSGYKFHFYGNRIAEIATGMIYHNMKNLLERTDDDGFIHTSYKGAPSWRYDGFGPYVPNADSYYGSFYSRDGARAIMTLNGFGHVQDAENGCDYGNRCVLQFPEQNLTIGGGIPIPGHFTVVPNDPLLYSKVLTDFGWPTHYTKERFGDEYANIGNPETDGHGLMMMATHQVWCNRKKSPDFVKKNWAYICECAKWIKWSFDYPELSFAKEDLLYGETEAAMNTYTMYANLPCHLGLLGYAEMAEAIGETDCAAEWRALADRLQRGINAKFPRCEGWDMEQVGFLHDPVPTMLSDYYGYDTDDMPAEWVARSRASHKEDLFITGTAMPTTPPFGGTPASHQSWFGSSGIGYNHSMITQNSLLLDEMSDAGKLVENLCKLSYSPRLPEPYIVPECIVADEARGILRRQGDLGNLVQLAEAMKCLLLVSGIAPLKDGILKIMPRLPEGWAMDIRKFPVQNSDITMDIRLTYPEGDSQSADIELHGDAADAKMRFRFGPFAKDVATANVTLNGTSYKVDTFASGDSRWAWLDV